MGKLTDDELRPFLHSHAKFDFRTYIEDKAIYQDVYLNIDDMRRKHVSHYLNTKEKGVREALIKLGWKPPEVTTEDDRLMMNDLATIGRSYFEFKLDDEGNLKRRHIPFSELRKC